MLFNHENPGDLCVLHDCDNPPCVNPLHLFLGTHQDNRDDCCSKGRHNRGEKQGISKLAEEKVRWIRKLYAGRHGTQQEIGALFGVSPNTIGCVVRRKTWAHVA